MNTFKDYINQVTDLIGNTITNLLLTAAVAAFMFAVVSFIWKRANGSSGDGIKDARNQLGWSIVALFVMFSIWGIISFLQSGIFGPGGTKTQIEAPSIKVNTSAGSNNANPSANTSGSQAAPGAQSNVSCPAGQVYDSRLLKCVTTRGGQQPCNTYTNIACPSSYCKLDSVEGTCVSK